MEWISNERPNGPNLTKRRAQTRRRPDWPSSVAGSVLHHPSYKFPERITRVGGQFGHQARLGHAGLRVDFENHKFTGSTRRIVISQVSATDPPATECLMRR